jgi:hypothetical protein
MNRPSQRNQVVVTAEERLSRRWGRVLSISIDPLNRNRDRLQTANCGHLDHWLDANEREHDQQSLIDLVQSDWGGLRRRGDSHGSAIQICKARGSMAMRHVSEIHPFIEPCIFLPNGNGSLTVADLTDMQNSYRVMPILWWRSGQNPCTNSKRLT